MSAATLLSRLDADDAAPPRVRAVASPRRWRRQAMIVVGSALTGFGLVLVPVPGPFDVPVILLGLIVLLRHSPHARRRFVQAGRRYPRLFGPMRRLLRGRRRAAAALGSRH